MCSHPTHHQAPVEIDAVGVHDLAAETHPAALEGRDWQVLSVRGLPARHDMT